MYSHRKQQWKRIRCSCVVILQDGARRSKNNRESRTVHVHPNVPIPACITTTRRLRFLFILLQIATGSYASVQRRSVRASKITCIALSNTLILPVYLIPKSQFFN